MTLKIQYNTIFVYWKIDKPQFKNTEILTVLPPGKHAKNARCISLPSLRQHYLVTMAMSLAIVKIALKYFEKHNYYVVK